MKRLWTDKELKILKEDYPFVPTEFIADLFGWPIQRIYNKAFKLGLKKSEQYLNSKYSGRLMAKDTRGLPTRFKRGHKPWNKGMKGLCIGGRDTQFKKGNVPHNHRPVGSIRTDGEGYLWIKIEEPKKWITLHSYNWQAVNGDIPEGALIKFRDGNPLNCDVSNLYLSDRASNMKDNTIHRYPEELKSTIRVLGKLKRQINGKE
jgi:hypothetical protein